LGDWGCWVSAAAQGAHLDRCTSGCIVRGLIPVREAGARVEREGIGFLSALLSEGAVRWSSRLHLRCKSRCRSSGYWRELGMACLSPPLVSCNLLPTATVPQSTRLKGRNAPRHGANPRPDYCAGPGSGASETAERLRRCRRAGH
jgi:hypothetical protein